MKRKSLMWILILLPCLVLTACSQGSAAAAADSNPESGEEESTDDEGSAESSEPEKKEESPAALESKLVYKYWYNSYDGEATHYIYDLAGRLVKRELMFAPETEPYNEFTYNYAADGSLLSMENIWGDTVAEYGPDGTCLFMTYNSGSFTEFDDRGLPIHDYNARDMLHTYYTRDEEGRVLREEWYQGEKEDTDGSFESGYVYTYSEDGLSATVQAYGTDGNYTQTHTGYYDYLEYDSEGSLLFKHHASQSGEHDSEEIYEYDSDGNMISSIRKNVSSTSEDVFEEHYWTYENGVLLEDELIHYNVKILKTNELDENGNVIKTTVLQQNTNTGEVLKDYVSYLAEFDDRGNLSIEYSFADPSDDSYDDYVSGGYEIDGVEGADKITYYIYGYDGDPYNKLPEGFRPTEYE